MNLERASGEVLTLDTFALPTPDDARYAITVMGATNGILLRHRLFLKPHGLERLLWF